MLHTNRSQAGPARRGFTLVEVLVVLTIIIVLASLSTGAIMKVLSLQQRRNTLSEVSKLDGGVKKQWKAVLDTAKTETPHPIAVTLANYDLRRARVIHILMCLKREFPTSFTEATNPVPVPAATLATLGLPAFGPNPAYTRILANANTNAPADDQTSACLYMALKQVRRGTDFDPDTALSSQEIGDTPSNPGVKEILDGWGQPVVFIRWPNQSVAPYDTSQYTNSPTNNNTVGTAIAYNSTSPPDPEDPEGLLEDPTWLQTLQNANMVALASAVFTFNNPPASPYQNPQQYYPLASQKGQQYRLTPVILSKGPKNKLYVQDNIVNFLLAPLAQ